LTRDYEKNYPYIGVTESAVPPKEVLKYEDVAKALGDWVITRPHLKEQPRYETKKHSMPSDAAARKASPIAEGVLWYFPNALAAIAEVSKKGNDQHNPGQPMHWSRGKSNDHADCILRHLIDAGTMDGDGVRHTAKVAWRALALLQEELEREEGFPLPRNAK
jgi:hypothetical protein